MIPAFRGESVTRLRAVASDNGYGGIEADWTTPEELSLAGCGLAPITVEELLAAGRDAAEDAWTLYAPQADVRHSDRIQRATGETFEVDGHPNVWRSPHTGREPGMTVRMRRIAGPALGVAP